MVMSQTLYQLLGQRHPGCQIDVVAPPWSQPLLQRMPEVRQGFSLNIAHGEFNVTARRKLAQELKQRKYQQAILLPNSWKSALIPFMAKIPKRSGWLGEMRWGLLNDVRHLDKQQYPLMIERFMALALPADAPLEKPYVKPALRVEDESRQQAVAELQLQIDKPILALCPGAEFGPAKRWPEEHYAKVANEYLRAGYQIWIFGSKNDTPVAEKIQQLTQKACVDLTGKTSLGQAIDLLSLANCVVTNDSGLMHIAAALGRPLVAIYGSSDPSFTPPLHEQVKIVRLGIECSPCFKRECPWQHLKCLKDLQPQLVLNAITELAIE